MTRMGCSICLDSREVFSESKTARDVFEQIFDFQLPEDSWVCYICSHLVLKLARFRNMCVETCSQLQEYCTQKESSNINMDDYGSMQHQKFGKTNMNVNNICSYIECDESLKFNDYSNHNTDFNHDEDMFATYSNSNNDNGVVTHVTSHSFTTKSDNYSIKDVDNHSDKSSCSNDSESHNNEDEPSNSFKGYESDAADANDVETFTRSEDRVDHLEGNESATQIETNEDRADEQKPFFVKTVLSMEEQKGELESLRKDKKYLEAEFKCYNCALGFALKDSYQSHMVRHEESNGEHWCAVCGLRFAGAGVRSMHAALHAERYRCSRCGLAVKRPRRRQHAARCWRDERAACHLCGKLFADNTRLQQHLRRLHAARPARRYACQQCSRVYRDAASLRVHTITHSGKRFRCARCPSTFATPYSLGRHAAQHDSPRPAYCAPCGAWFASPKTYRAHIRTAASHRTESHGCPVCGRACATRRSLEGHLRCRHARDAPHACAACPARYSTARSLARHVRGHAARAGELAVCHLCGRCYKGKNKLNRHLREVCEPKNLDQEFGDHT